MLCHDSFCVQVPLHFPCCSEAKSFGPTVRHRRSQITGALQHRTWVEVSVWRFRASNLQVTLPIVCHTILPIAFHDTDLLATRQLNLVSFGTVMTACVAAAQWLQALDVFRAARSVATLGALQTRGRGWADWDARCCSLVEVDDSSWNVFCANCGVMGYQTHKAQPHPILVCFRLMKSCTSSDDAYPQFRFWWTETQELTFWLLGYFAEKYDSLEEHFPMSQFVVSRWFVCRNPQLWTSLMFVRFCRRRAV